MIPDHLNVNLVLILNRNFFLDIHNYKIEMNVQLIL